MTLEEAYCLLEVHQSADEATVKTAYKKMALKTHPDKNPNDPDARHKFQKVSEAYKRITDPESFKEEDDEMDFDMDMDELNQMFFSMFEDMIPMMMEGDFNPARMSGGAVSLFDILSGGMGGGMFMDDSEDDSDDEEGYIPDGDLEDVMAAMMMGGMGGVFVGDSKRSVGLEEMMLMEQMLTGMPGAGLSRRGKASGVPSGWIEDDFSPSSKKKKSKKKKKGKKVNKTQKAEEETKWETDSEDDISSPTLISQKASAAAWGRSLKEPVVHAERSSVNSSRNKSSKVKSNELGSSMDFDLMAEMSTSAADASDMEAMMMAMMMAGGSSAGLDGLFSDEPRSGARKKRQPAASTKRSTSRVPSEDDIDRVGELYEEGDVVVVNKK